MESIWNLAIWVGNFLISFIVIIALMQFISMISNWVDKQDTKISTLTMVKAVPFFIIVIPIINVILKISQNADNMADFYISTVAYETLIKETAPMVGTFIMVWAIVYVLILFGFYRYGDGLK